MCTHPKPKEAPKEEAPKPKPDPKEEEDDPEMPDLTDHEGEANDNEVAGDGKDYKRVKTMEFALVVHHGLLMTSSNEKGQ